MTNETSHPAATVAEPGAHVAPAKPFSRRDPAEEGRAQKGPKGAQSAQTRGAQQTAKTGKKQLPASAPRAESKGATILELIGRPEGATLAEIHEDYTIGRRIMPTLRIMPTSAAKPAWEAVIAVKEAA